MEILWFVLAAVALVGAVVLLVLDRKKRKRSPSARESWAKARGLGFAPEAVLPEDLWHGDLAGGVDRIAARVVAGDVDGREVVIGDVGAGRTVVAMRREVGSDIVVELSRTGEGEATAGFSVTSSEPPVAGRLMDLRVLGHLETLPPAADLAWAESQWACVGMDASAGASDWEAALDFLPRMTDLLRVLPPEGARLRDVAARSAPEEEAEATPAGQEPVGPPADSPRTPPPGVAPGRVANPGRPGPYTAEHLDSAVFEPAAAEDSAVEASGGAAAADAPGDGVEGADTVGALTVVDAVAAPSVRLRAVPDRAGTDGDGEEGNAAGYRPPRPASFVPRPEVERPNRAAGLRSGEDDITPIGEAVSLPALGSPPASFTTRPAVLPLPTPAGAGDGRETGPSAEVTRMIPALSEDDGADADVDTGRYVAPATAGSAAEVEVEVEVEPAPAPMRTSEDVPAAPGPAGVREVAPVDMPMRAEEVPAEESAEEGTPAAPGAEVAGTHEAAQFAEPEVAVVPEPEPEVAVVPEPEPEVVAVPEVEVVAVPEVEVVAVPEPPRRRRRERGVETPSPFLGETYRELLERNSDDQETEVLWLPPELFDDIPAAPADGREENR